MRRVPFALLVVHAFLLASACVAPGAGPVLRDVAVTPAAGRLEPARRAEPDWSRSSFFLVHVGGRELEDDGFYEPVDQPLSFGFDTAHRFSKRSPIGFEAGFSLAADAEDETVMGTDVDYASVFLEGNVGLRAMFDAGPAHLYVGGGIAFVAADIEIDPDLGLDVSEEDGSTGQYLHGGVLFKAGGSFVLGVEAKILRGTDIEFDGFVDTDADYQEVSFVFGWAL